MHSLGEKVLSNSPISFDRALRSRLADLRSRALSLAKELFYRVQIRRVGWQKEYEGSGRGDRFLDSRHLVTAEVVEDHGVSRLEGWAQELTHISQKHLAVHRPVGDHRRGQSAAARSAHKGRRLPMPVGC